MKAKDEKKEMTDPGPIFVVSGGAGSSGEQLVRTALAQFGRAEAPLVTVPRVRSPAGIEKVVKRAASASGTIVHTLVDARLRRMLGRLARERNVVAIDLMGPLLSRLERLLQQKPVGQPGLYRQLREDYFKRIEAIEYTVAHDDGRNPQELHLAEIVLIGVSRVGKTPLSMYLSLLGWKVANVPILKDIPPPEELSRVGPGRVVGLTIDLPQLLAHRRLRSRRVGMGAGTGYTDTAELRREAETVFQLCRKNGYPVVDVTEKPIEESASEVIAVVGRRRVSPSDAPGDASGSSSGRKPARP